ncbi:MAG: hypothetical protein ACLVAK_07950 [Clostridia bacterium]
MENKNHNEEVRHQYWINKKISKKFDIALKHEGYTSRVEWYREQIRNLVKNIKDKITISDLEKIKYTSIGLYDRQLDKKINSLNIIKKEIYNKDENEIDIYNVEEITYLENNEKKYAIIDYWSDPESYGAVMYLLEEHLEPIFLLDFLNFVNTIKECGSREEAIEKLTKKEMDIIVEKTRLKINEELCKLNGQDYEKEKILSIFKKHNCVICSYEINEDEDNGIDIFYSVTPLLSEYPDFLLSKIANQFAFFDIVDGKIKKNR